MTMIKSNIKKYKILPISPLQKSAKTDKPCHSKVTTPQPKTPQSSNSFLDGTTRTQFKTQVETSRQTKETMKCSHLTWKTKIIKIISC